METVNIFFFFAKCFPYPVMHLKPAICKTCTHITQHINTIKQILSSKASIYFHERFNRKYLKKKRKVGLRNCLYVYRLRTCYPFNNGSGHEQSTSNRNESASS